MDILSSRLYATYSIVARDPETGQLGAAVQTHQMKVGCVVPWLLPGVGAVVTQSMTNVSFGPIALAMLREGVPAPNVVAALVASDSDARRRQVAVVDARGQVGAWTGEGCIAHAAHCLGAGFSVQANMMTRAAVIASMAAAFESASGDLAQRMLAALEAAQREGGDIRGMQSAALKVVPGAGDGPFWEEIYDLRVDEHANPLGELARLVRLNRAQIVDSAGHRAHRAGEREQALARWAEARELAPELEELAYWQALTLADSGDLQTALAILRPMLAGDDRREHWIDLIVRLQDCGILETAGIANRLVAALR